MSKSKPDVSGVMAVPTHEEMKQLTDLVARLQDAPFRLESENIELQETQGVLSKENQLLRTELTRSLRRESVVQKRLMLIRLAGRDLAGDSMAFAAEVRRIMEEEDDGE